MAIEAFHESKLFVICTCGCMVSYLKEDVDHNYTIGDWDNNGDYDLWWTIVCPRCSRRIKAELAHYNE